MDWSQLPQSDNVEDRRTVDTSPSGIIKDWIRDFGTNAKNIGRQAKNAATDILQDIGVTKMDPEAGVWAQQAKTPIDYSGVEEKLNKGPFDRQDDQGPQLSADNYSPMTQSQNSTFDQMPYAGGNDIQPAGELSEFSDSSTNGSGVW